MKKITILTITLIIIISSLNIIYGAVVNKNLRAKFTEKDLAGTNFKEITITPYYSTDDDDEEDTYNIYLPSGYFVEGKSASFVADKNGDYPFTVYEGSYKRTFTYEVDTIDDIRDRDDSDRKKIHFTHNLLYDYEKKQIIFNMQIDKLRNVTTPDGASITNEVNYYIKTLENNIIYDFSIIIDKESFDYKIIKSGEYYLLISVYPVNYNNHSPVVEYFGYNFTNNETYTSYPPNDIYDDNGNYKVLVQSPNNQHLFNLNITGIDFRRPDVDIEFSDDDTLTLEMEDDFGLGYIITYDGKYVKLNGKTATYKHPTEIKYNGEYIFIVVDEKGNRTVENFVIKSETKIPRRLHAIELDVHESKYSENIFENIGTLYRNEDDDTVLFENILPAYMNGKSAEHFNPDYPITRAEMITIFCRLNDLPYDTSAYLKSKFTDIDNHWARDYISMGSSKKYVSGYKDKTFKPDNNVTRAEFCQMLTKISAYKSLLNAIPASTNNDYIDIANHWAEKEIIKISSRNLLGSSSNYFYPDQPITRGEVVHAINMLYGFNPSYLELSYTNSLYSKYYDFKDIEQHPYYYDIIISLVGMYREKVNN